MFKVILWLFVIWVVAVGGSELLIAAVSNDMNDIVSNGVTEMETMSDLDNYPGLEDSFKSFPVWKWFLTPIVGFIATGIVLYKYRDELRGSGE